MPTTIHHTPNKKEPTTFGLAGVGPQIEKYLAKLNIYTPRDLLFHFPGRYQDRTQVQSIRSLIADDDVVIEGEITSVSYLERGRTKLLAEFSDGTGRVFFRFFHLHRFQTESLKVGVRLRVFGRTRRGKKGLEISHPEYHVLQPDKPIPKDEYLTPFYPATEGLTQYVLRKITTNALHWMRARKVILAEQLDALFTPLGLPTFADAIQTLHHAPATIDLKALQTGKTLAHKRLIFEELLAHRLSLLQAKHRFQACEAQALTLTGKLTNQFIDNLPYQLTRAQARVVKEVAADLARAFPMLRLVQGDVGSGKTVVAAMAILQAVENGCQAALMAPTELLAEQHYQTISQWFEPLGVNVVFLSGNVTAKTRRAAMAAMESGNAEVIIGTHALFQEDIHYKRLALVLIDEQHRFGVHQRATLRNKGLASHGKHAHQLILTATPIPRTLAMSLYSDLDCSTIDELPPGRKPVQTSVIAGSRRDEIIARIEEACRDGRQVYWVCPLIEESEVLNCQSAIHTAECLQEVLGKVKVGLVHGRMKSKDKEAVMQRFKAGDIQLLVATTVIEVGVDVPNASLMVIENAERLGLSQLHQLRGRVGRGSQLSHCVLLYDYPISQVGKERLAVMRETNDGFKIAQRDLELRGAGEVLGTRQTGELTFKVADMLRDQAWFPEIQAFADKMLKHYPQEIECLTQRWLAHKADYAKV